MKVKVVRIYLSEDSPLIDELFTDLKKASIRGATVFRGVKGFGQSGMIRNSGLVDLHFELPMVFEFFDVPEKVDAILNQLSNKIESGRVLHWSAEVE